MKYKLWKETFGPKRDEATGDWRKMFNGDLKQLETGEKCLMETS
jgi:hypothetical protein